MASEFYHKTAALFEEFKKRELRSLHFEKGTKSSLNWNESNMSNQDYLQKINKRERDTEQAYRELMKHMEDLDKQTDQMSLKLEKLHALRNIAISSNTAWPSHDDTLNRPLQSYTGRTYLPNSSIVHSFPTSNVLHSMTADFTLPKFISHDESTQTDSVFCAQCRLPLTMNSNSTLDSSKTITSINESVALLDNLNVNIQNCKGGLEFIPSIPLNTIKETYTTANNINEKHGYANSQQDSSVEIPEFSEISNAMVEVPTLKFADDAKGYRNSQQGSSVKIPEFSEIGNATAEVPTLKFADDTKGYRETEVHFSKLNDHPIGSDEKECVDENMRASETIQHTVSKSDDESMNHEFDFLESDKRRSIKSDDMQLNPSNFNNQTLLDSGNFILEDTCDSTVEENSANSRKINSVPSDTFDFKKQEQSSESPYQFDSENMERIQINKELKLDSSVSGGHPSPFYSENASLASESDSFSDRETPWTSTAAYQALLGNVSAGKTAQKKPITDSDSEDDIENALASAVRKSSNVTFEPPALVQKTDERKESVVEAKLKTKTKVSITSNKPQAKLSKNTRKVLGLDTSSGSEVELAEKTSLNKNADDSDEFDFYD